jgi:hypothetical protein
MAELSEDEWRLAFPMWLRTGRLPSIRNGDAIERKFNPWHDPEDGRFTFAGTGRYHGGGFGGGGATGTWPRSQPKRVPADRRKSAATVVTAGQPAIGRTASSSRSAAVSEKPFREVVRNGYTYQVDARNRTRGVSGALTVANTPIRSRTSQRQAGETERRVTDDGGHYIAARFNGPTDAFNHFAQDANFNRGGYRVLEDDWARDKRVGRSVNVKIIPRYDGASIRPSMIDVRWTVDGKNKSLKFLNEPSERSRGK